MSSNPTTHHEESKLYWCEILGVLYFKKYWPNGGSYWNDEHISSNNIDDLRNVLQFSRNLTLIHKGVMIQEFFICLALAYMGHITTYDTFKILMLLSIIHSYVLMVQYYNITKAKSKIEEIYLTRDISRGITKDEPIICGLGLQIDQIARKYFRLYHDTYQQVGPIFIDKDKALEFSQYLLKAFDSEEQLLKAMYLNDKKIYRSYLIYQSNAIVYD